MDKKIDICGICSSLTEGGFTAKFRGLSAIDKYLGLPALPYIWIETNADIAALARLCENLRFPGVEIADGAVDTIDGVCYFNCVEPDAKENDSKGQYDGFSLLSFLYDSQTGSYKDPEGIYNNLRELKQRKASLMEEDKVYLSSEYLNSLKALWPNNHYAFFYAALLLARYGYIPELNNLSVNNFQISLKEPEMQRAFLSCLMLSPRPDWGLELLKNTGLLEILWPEIAIFDNVDHSKEFHPEGNVWNHTLETFRHRKASASGVYDLRLSLGLLLHDAGKPIADASGGHRFEGHAELGARAASRFLERLEYPPSIVHDVYYLVRNHMLPAALKRLPLSKTAEIMASPLFPTLMELYRCDESSSFKGLDGYYENSAAYRTFLKNTKNPYRSLDGKKIGRLEIYKKI